MTYRNTNAGPTFAGGEIMTSQEKYNALKKVVEFAKANGFPDANLLFWDYDGPEIGFEDVEEIFNDADCNIDYSIALGLSLGSVIDLVKTDDDCIKCSDSGEILQ